MPVIKHLKTLAIFSFLLFGCQIQQNEIPTAQEVVMEFTYENPARIGTWHDWDFYEGGFSGLYYIPNTHYEFILINDRGPNIPITDTLLTAGEEVKLFPFPDYTQKLVHVKASNGRLEVLNTQPLMFKSGEKLTGVPPSTKLTTYKEIAWSSLNKDIIAPAKYGVDIEGLTVVNDTILWFCEEYRPSIWQINLNRMSIENIFTPENGSLPEILSKRSPNRGFEAITYSNGKIVAMMQSPLSNPDKALSNKTRLNRIIELNTYTGEVNTYVYEMNDVRGKIKLQDWKIGDITHYKDNLFVVLEHAQRENEQYIELYLIDLSAATGLQSNSPEHTKLESYLTSENLSNKANLRTVSKIMVLDVIQAGFDVSLGKPEGISLISPNLIAILNDNDYGVSETSDSKRIQVINRPTKICVFPIKLD